MPGGFTANALALGAGGSPALAVARAENNTKTCAAITAFMGAQGLCRNPISSLPFEVYDLIKASRSALIVSASVVGMPCGKPL